MLPRLCVLLAATMLNGCGWFEGKASPLQSAPLRPGVDRQTTASGLPPAPNRGSYDAGVAPAEDNRGQPLGTIVAGKGGQKAQIEAAEKDRSQREAEREKERAEREAELKREKMEEGAKGAPPAAPPADLAPPAPAATPDQAPIRVPVPASEPQPSSPPTQR